MTEGEKMPYVHLSVKELEEVPLRGDKRHASLMKSQQILKNKMMESLTKSEPPVASASKVKKSVSGFSLFYQENRNEVVKNLLRSSHRTGEEVTVSKIQQEVARRWIGLGGEERVRYQSRAQDQTKEEGDLPVKNDQI